MSGLGWKLRVWLSRWRHRVRYALAAPAVYRNWWALPLPKLGVSVVLETRNDVRYLVRAGTADLAAVNETCIGNPYLGNGHISLAADAVVIDVGAYIGDFTMQAARRCPRGRIIAVEPIREHLRGLETHILINGVDNVVPVHCALGAADGEIDVHLDGTGSSAYHGDGAAETTRVTTLPALMREQGIDAVDLLKLDCEGAEWDILPTLESDLRRVRQVAMEFHCGRGWTPDSLADWFRQRGYWVWHTGGTWNGMLWAVRQDG